MSRVNLLNFQPWRFEPGDHVYVRQWPHYLVMDSVGIEWRISQIELSGKPIITP